MKRALLLCCILGACGGSGPDANVGAPDDLAAHFSRPPDSAKPWCYWWWLNGVASKEGITRDFEEMRKQGINGALLFDAGMAGPGAPRGPQFMSAEWRELYKHAVREADRCGIVLGVNLCSGWNAGGPWVTGEHAAKKLVSAQTVVKGPGRVTVMLPKPAAVQGFYRDITVLAAPVPKSEMPAFTLTASSQYDNFGPALAGDGAADTRWVSNGNKPGMGPTPKKPEYLQFDFVDAALVAGLYLKPYSHCPPKDIEIQCSENGQNFRPVKRVTLEPGKEVTVPFDEVRAKCFRVVFLSSYPFRAQENWNVQVAEIALRSKGELAGKTLPGLLWDQSRVVEVTKFVDGNGQLDWDVPAGNWNVQRIGYTLHGKLIKIVGGGPEGPEIDPMSAAAMDAHFAETGAKLIADAGPLVGKTLQYFHIDSWELGQPTWTPRMREEFQQRRGYDPLPWLPAVLGQTVDNAVSTRRFLQEYRRTVADLVAENYYGRFRELTVKGGLRGTHPESGGPTFTQWIDALQCEGINDVPMGEFWKRRSEPDGQVRRQPSLKQAASAAHIYGKRDCQAEAFTSFADDWIDDPWSMKDIGDAAFCEGLTRNVLCFWVHQPQLDAKPGFQWAHVGTHFDSNLTWWPMSGAWLTYLARCQHMLGQGLFVADFAYLQDEAIPGFIALRHDQQPVLPDGFDYDVLNAEVLLNRAAAVNGRLSLPDGMSYRYLILPHQPDAILSPAVLGKVAELAAAGVTVIGPKRREEALDTVVRTDGLAPDIEFRDSPAGATFDWIHRRDRGTDIYFLCNQGTNTATAQIAFRVTGKQPELWDAVTGEIRVLPEFREEAGRTVVPLEFAPRQSWFVVFRKGTAEKSPENGGRNFTGFEQLADIPGPWEVSFNPKFGGPERATFDRLVDWSQNTEDGIRYYSGTATYKNSFQWKAASTDARQLFLDLGVVKNVARVRLNGHDLGVVWTAPWQVEITGAVKVGANELEIEVANLWPNRLIGDAALPKEKRFTITNVRTYETIPPPENEYTTYRCPICAERRKTGRPAELLPSGLLGPVTLRVAEKINVR